MDITPFCEQPLKFDGSEKLSKIVSRMHSEKKHEAFIFNGKQFAGVLSAADIVSRNMQDTDKIKVGSLNMIKQASVFSPGTPLKELTTAILVGNYRSLPIEVDGELLALSKLNLLKALKNELPKGTKAEDIMFFPNCASSDDNISVAKAVLRQNHVYRMVVLNKQDKVEGVIDELDLLNLFSEKIRQKRGGIVAEKKKEDVSISSRLIMQDSFIAVSPLAEIKYVVEAMLKNNNDTAVVMEDGKLLGLITPREIIKTVIGDIGGVYVRVSGIQDEDAFLRSIVDSEIRNTVRKIGKIVRIQYMTLNVKREKVPGKLAIKKVNYVVLGKIVSDSGVFVSSNDAWDLSRAMKGSLKILEKEVIRKSGRERSFGRERGQEE